MTLIGGFVRKTNPCVFRKNKCCRKWQCNNYNIFIHIYFPGNSGYLKNVETLTHTYMKERERNNNNAYYQGSGPALLYVVAHNVTTNTDYSIRVPFLKMSKQRLTE